MSRKGPVHQAAQQTPRILRTRGWITPLVDAITGAILRPARTLLLGERDMGTISREAASRRARWVDSYVACWCIVEVVCLTVVTMNAEHPAVQRVAAIVIVLRILEMLSSAIRAALFDRDILPPSHQPRVASHARMIVLGFVNYLELFVCFGVLYALSPCDIQGYRDWFDAVYLSAMAQLTIGFGDVYPTHWLRVLAVIQGISALVLLVLLIGRYVAFLRREESLDEQRQVEQSSKG